MTPSAWRLLLTLTDLPTAQSLAEVLAGEGIAVRVMSDAGVLGQAAPSRIYVDAQQYASARHSLAQRRLSDEELESLAGDGGCSAEP
jgi:Putative prokaryotic signal transducing protein